MYEKLTYCDFEHVSFARYPDIKNRLIVANGYSKSHAMTGWRLGYAIGPKNIIKRMNKLQQHINTNTCTFVQKGACSIYKNEPSHIGPYVRELQKRAEFFHNALNNNGTFKGIKPKAGFFTLLIYPLPGWIQIHSVLSFYGKRGLRLHPELPLDATGTTIYAFHWLYR